MVKGAKREKVRLHRREFATELANSWTELIWSYIRTASWAVQFDMTVLCQNWTELGSNMIMHRLKIQPIGSIQANMLITGKCRTKNLTRRMQDQKMRQRKMQAQLSGAVAGLAGPAFSAPSRWELRTAYQLSSLWSPYVIGQTIIFLPCDFYLSFFHRLISAAVDWMSTILSHMVWP